MARFNLLQFFTCLFLIFFSLQAHCQKKKIKFGDVSLEELQMSTYANDTTADAVILYDKGHFVDRDLSFVRHVRVKILKQSGTSWGNWTINAPYKSDMKIFVFNLKDGEIVKEKVDNSAIHEEQVIDDFYVYKVFAPNVQPGTVIDITYSHLGLPREWRFQERIPVVYNELILDNSTYVSYRKTFLGFEPIETLSPSRWRAENMPAFKTEPYLNHYGNYITKFQIQITSLGRPGYNYVEFSTSWQNINRVLLEYSGFGGLISGSGFLNSAAKQVMEQGGTTEEKIFRAYEYIKNNIKWNGTNALVGSSDTKRHFQNEHTGNSAEINLLLVSLLDKIGIKSYAVVLSTRDNGFLLQHSPSLNQLNYVIAYINHEGTEMLLDATSENLIPGILPAKCLNGQGLVVHKDHALWVDLNPGKVNKKRQFLNVKINEDATGSASVTQQYFDYGFLKWAALKEENQDDSKYIQHVEKVHSTPEITGYELNERNANTLKAKETFQIDLTENIVDLGQELIVSPFVMNEYAENPFKSETRKYPVDLSYPSEFNNIVLMDIPENLQIKSVPESVSLKMQSGGANFTFLSNVQGNKIQFQVQLNLNRAVFTEAEYLELKQFFSYVIEKMNESVVLTKKA